MPSFAVCFPHRESKQRGAAYPSGQPQGHYAMKPTMQSWFALCLALLTAPAAAELPVGSAAPRFTAPASLAGKSLEFSLETALQQGPVVLYFFPAAFTKGCTIEAHMFAEASDDFKAQGATVIGVSGDDIATLHKFSVSECRNRFAVVSDPDLTITKAYDAKVKMLGYADRSSFVITPDGLVRYVYSALSPNQHVKNTLNAVRQWKTSSNPTP